jgi:hypothetical protein
MIPQYYCVLSLVVHISLKITQKVSKHLSLYLCTALLKSAPLTQAIHNILVYNKNGAYHLHVPLFPVCSCLYL